METFRDGWQGLNLDNLMIVRVKVPLPKCRGKSTIPTVATGHQSVKRDRKVVSGSPIWKPIKQDSMSSVSEDVSKLSSTTTSQIRLTGWSQKAKDKGLAVKLPTNKHSR